MKNASFTDTFTKNGIKFRLKIVAGLITMTGQRGNGPMVSVYEGYSIQDAQINANIAHKCHGALMA